MKIGAAEILRGRPNPSYRAYAKRSSEGGFRENISSAALSRFIRIDSYVFICLDVAYD